MVVALVGGTCFHSYHHPTDHTCPDKLKSIKEIAIQKNTVYSSLQS